MKKISLFFILAFLVAPAVSSASINANLKYGAKGQAVIELQDLLASENCLNTTSSGYFGLLTVKGVKCFQSKYGLPSTGYFGAMSRERANGILAQALGESNRAEKVESAITSVATPPSLTQTQTTTSGCASTLGFSVTTGQSCAKVNTPTASWSDLENQNFPENIKKGSLSITLTNSLGEQHYYRLENGVYVQKNTHAAALESFTYVSSFNIAPATPLTTQTAPTPAQTSGQLSNPLILTLGSITTSGNSAHFEWDTNKPSNSKIFITNSAGNTTVVQSLSGLSTHHIADNYLSVGFTFSYVIEAIAGDEVQKKSGTFSKRPEIAVLFPDNYSGQKDVVLINKGAPIRLVVYVINAWGGLNDTIPIHVTTDYPNSFRCYSQIISPCTATSSSDVIVAAQKGGDPALGEATIETVFGRSAVIRTFASLDGVGNFDMPGAYHYTFTLPDHPEVTKTVTITVGTN